MYTQITTNLYIYIILFKFPLPPKFVSHFPYNFLKHSFLSFMLILMS